MDVHGGVIVVTGASAGLGRAFTRTLVARGAEVYGIARHMEALQALGEECGAAFHPVQCDVTQEAQVKGVFERLARDPGRVDVLINNAGLGRFGELENMSTEHWSEQIDTNLSGVFFCTRQVIPLMKAQNAQDGFGGHIVNIASIAGLIGNANLSVYNATKFGLRGFSEALMKELRADGVKVTSICPGSVGTDFGRKAGSHGAAFPMRAEDIAATVAHVLEGPDNYLISEVVMRPLRPKG